jgi:thioredoxin 1
MGKVFEACDRGFELQVMKAKEPVLCVFTAPWCVSCKALHPQIEGYAEEDYTKIVEIDVDKCPETAQKFSEHLRSVPTMMLFKRGNVILEIHGPKSKKEIKELVLAALERTKNG